MIQSDESNGLTENYGRHLGYIWFHLAVAIDFNDIAKEGNITISEGWHLLNYELLKYGLGTKSSAKNR